MSTVTERRSSWSSRNLAISTVDPRWSMPGDGMKTTSADFLVILWWFLISEHWLTESWSQSVHVFWYINSEIGHVMISLLCWDAYMNWTFIFVPSSVRILLTTYYCLTSLHLKQQCLFLYSTISVVSEEYYTKLEIRKRKVM